MKTLETSLRVINDLIRRWRQLLPSSAADVRLEPQLNALSSEIAGALWKPLQPSCRGAKLLWVSPVGVLWAFPFAALTVGDGEYLIRSTPIAYAVSALQAAESLAARPRTPPGPANALIVAEIQHGLGLPMVAESRRVADDFGRRFPNRAPIRLTGEGATKDEFLKALRHSGQHVCFIGHGIWSPVIEEEQALFPTLMNGRAAPSGRADEGLTADPYRFRLPLAGASHDQSEPGWQDKWITDDELADAVPPDPYRFELFVCYGFVGPLLPTEGLMSFPRTLLRAGYHTVLSAQWMVLDHMALATLPQTFHAGVYDEQLGDAVALQRAQCDLIDLGEVNRHPYHWSGWTVVGDPGSLRLPPAPGCGPQKGSSASFHWAAVLFALVAASAVIIFGVSTLLRRIRLSRSARSGPFHK